MDPPDTAQVEQLIRFHLQTIAGLCAVYLGLRWMAKISRSKSRRSARRAVGEPFRGRSSQIYLAWGAVLLGIALIVFAFAM